jgi:tRNA(Ile)-lysidine synthase
MSGNMKISDFLINQKVSLLDKKDILVLASKNNILWVCGMRINDKFKITPSTTRFLKVEFHKKDNDNE